MFNNYSSAIVSTFVRRYQDLQKAYYEANLPAAKCLPVSKMVCRAIDFYWAPDNNVLEPVCYVNGDHLRCVIVDKTYQAKSVTLSTDRIGVKGAYKVAHSLQRLAFREGLAGVLAYLDKTGCVQNETKDVIITMFSGDVREALQELA